MAFLQTHMFSAPVSQNLLYCGQYLPESGNSAEVVDIFLEFQQCDQFTDYATHVQAMKHCPDTIVHTSNGFSCYGLSV